ncbi:MAG TPA: hypothetical protein VEJ67_06900 [Candidatus Cybelea sp.]|nr:hypothetical protein [Candidatus Cybelea sp.]
MFPGVPIPVCFLGFFFSGSGAVLVLAISTAAQVVFAAGLLKLKNWGRLGSITLECLAIANLVLTDSVPANRIKFQAIMESVSAAMSARMPQPVPVVFPVWLILTTSLPIFALILWFLVTRKHAFTSSAHRPGTPGDG